MIMAVKVVDNRLIITCGELTGGEEVHAKIKTLLRTLMCIEEDALNKNEIYEIALMIWDLLPEAEQFNEMLKK